MPHALSPADEARVVDAIRAAEAGNRGEVRVHVERRCGDSALGAARRWFFELDMHRTAADTGVLIYVAHADRQAAVFAGGALHAEVAPAEWQAVIDAVIAGYRAGRPADGLCDGLARVGDILRAALPGEDIAGNELPDAISTAGD